MCRKGAWTELTVKVTSVIVFRGAAHGIILLVIPCGRISMKALRNFIIKLLVTVCLLAVLVFEGFLLFCHYVEHASAAQTASEKWKQAKEWISGGSRTASAKASDSKGPDEQIVSQNRYMIKTSKEIIQEIIGKDIFIIPETAKNSRNRLGKDIISSDSSEEPETEAINESEDTDIPEVKETVFPTSISIEKTSKVADSTGMVTTDINELLEIQKADGIEENTGNQVQLEVEAILQYPELPTGCEVTSLAMALHYVGYNVSKEDLADHYLEKASPGSVSYKTAFWGDPREEDSFGCYAPVIVKAGNRYLAEQNSSCKAYNLTGSSFDDLLREIRMGLPVIVWGSMYIDGEIVFSYGWEIDGETVTWPSNEHCMLMTGFDMDSNTVTVCDPLNGVTSYDMNAFQHHYETMEQQAIVIY